MTTDCEGWEGRKNNSAPPPPAAGEGGEERVGEWERENKTDKDVIPWGHMDVGEEFPSRQNKRNQLMWMSQSHSVQQQNALRVNAPAVYVDRASLRPSVCSPQQDFAKN